MKLLKLSLVSVAFICTFAAQANEDTTYQALVDNLKQSHLAHLVTQEQKENLENNYQSCLAQLASTKDRSETLQRQIEQQQKIAYSAAPTADKQFAEMELLSLRDQRETIERRNAQCKEIELKYASLNSKVTESAKKHSEAAKTNKQKLIDYLVNKNQLKSDSVIESIEYPCPTDNQVSCRKEATAAVLKFISEQRNVKLTSGTVINNFMVEEDKVTTASEAEFDKVEVLKAEYQPTTEGGTYFLEIQATFKNQGDSAQSSVDKTRIEAAVGRFLKALTKEYRGS
ncbi:hypothetical protein ACMZOO_09285 [Catenovulum sp. SX2]|uniref:hypothetical protein n=1 Tax=Catenovulum sp. SX2 TaxID=3398614 RepID=UPI003F87601F